MRAQQRGDASPGRAAPGDILLLADQCFKGCFEQAPLGGLLLLGVAVVLACEFGRPPDRALKEVDSVQLGPADLNAHLVPVLDRLVVPVKADGDLCRGDELEPSLDKARECGGCGSPQSVVHARHGSQAALQVLLVPIEDGLGIGVEEVDESGEGVAPDRYWVLESVGRPAVTERVPCAIESVEDLRRTRGDQMEREADV